MDVMEEQNSLEISVNSTPVSEKSTKYSNSAGRPKKCSEIKFSPQPRSIVSQLLKEEKTRKLKQDLVRNNDISEECDAPEISDEPEPKKQSTSQSIKIYNCEHPSCTYTTSTSSNLIKHKRKHTSEKPYMCDQCTFRTNFINSLTVHKRIHTGERPFVCKHCNYRSNSSSNLKKHCLHKHTGIT